MTDQKIKKKEKNEEKQEQPEAIKDEKEEKQTASAESSGEPKDECEEWKEKAGEWEEKYKRALADYHNLVKRMQDEKADLGHFANKELLLRLLPVLDTLMLARQHSQDQTLAVTTQQFLDVLRAEGVEKIKTKSQDFDPRLMEAIDTVEGGDNKAIEEVRAGYTLHDKLLRPAQVRVGRGKSNLDDR